MKVLLVTTNAFPDEGTCTNIFKKLILDGKMSDCFRVDILAAQKSFCENKKIKFHNSDVYKVFSPTLVDRSDFIQLARKHFFVFLNGGVQRAFHHYEHRVIKSAFIDIPTKNSFYKALKRIKADRYDYIISISGRYDATAAVYKYCKRYNTPFILYQVDPCRTNKVLLPESMKNREKFEFDLFNLAKCVFTTSIIFDEYKDFEKYQQKMMVIEFPLIVPKVEKYEHNNPLRFIFLGSFYQGVRDPKATIDLITPLLVKNEAVLEFVGTDSSILTKEQKELSIICHGKKTIEECLSYMKQADVLVNVGNRIDNQVPSKIFDYISLGKPILNVYVNDNDPTLKYLDKYTLALSIKEEDVKKTEAKELLISFLNNLDNQIVDENNITSIFEECTPQYCVQQIERVLKG